MKKLIWIIDEEWSDYEVEIDILRETFPDCEIKISNYNYKEDLKNLVIRLMEFWLKFMLISQKTPLIN